MKVLFLGPETSPVLAYLRSIEDAAVAIADPVPPHLLELERPDFAVSHGYRHVVRPGVLDRMRDRIVNLHIALLPWNRGADPNFWSFVDNTPKGVTVHYMDNGIDTGAVIAQREVVFDGETTLRTTYERLQAELLDLFVRDWPDIRAGTCDCRPQHGAGTSHRARDLDAVRNLLTRGWDTPVADLSASGRALDS